MPEQRYGGPEMQAYTAERERKFRESSTIELQNETTQQFAGRTLKRGQRVLAFMTLSFIDLDGNQLPDETGTCVAYVSRIENDEPSFIAENPYKDKVIAIRQMRMPFAPSKDVLKLWSWTWPDEMPPSVTATS
jgi:hypothetical protein